MFKFLKEIKEAFHEGIEEGRAELAAEKEEEETKEAAEKALYEALSNAVPTIEQMALALSCPYREILTDGSNLRLFAFGKLDPKEEKSFKDSLYRDFGIEDEESVEKAFKDADESFAKSEISHEVFRPALFLYVITSSADVGYIDFSDYEELSLACIRQITNNQAIRSWEDYGRIFMEEECINNILGRKFLQRSIDRLQAEENSPWNIFPWDKMVEKAQS